MKNVGLVAQGSIRKKESHPQRALPESIYVSLETSTHGLKIKPRVRRTLLPTFEKCWKHVDLKANLTLWSQIVYSGSVLWGFSMIEPRQWGLAAVGSRAPLAFRETEQWQRQTGPHAGPPQRSQSKMKWLRSSSGVKISRRGSSGENISAGRGFVESGLGGNSSAKGQIFEPPVLTRNGAGSASTGAML